MFRPKKHAAEKPPAASLALAALVYVLPETLSVTVQPDGVAFEPAAKMQTADPAVAAVNVMAKVVPLPPVVTTPLCAETNAIATIQPALEGFVNPVTADDARTGNRRQAQFARRRGIAVGGNFLAGIGNPAHDAAKGV